MMVKIGPMRWQTVMIVCLLFYSMVSLLGLYLYQSNMGDHPAKNLHPVKNPRRTEVKQSSSVEPAIKSPASPPPPPPPPSDPSYADKKPTANSFIQRSNEFKKDGKWQEALDLLNEGLRLYPQSDQLHTYKGGWYFDKGNYSEAAKWYEKAHNINPQEVMYILNVGLCHSKLNQMGPAGDWYKKAYKMKPDTDRLLSLMSTLWKSTDWEDYYENEKKAVEATLEELKAGKTTSVGPFIALHLPFNLEQLLQISASHSKDIYNKATRNGKPNFSYERPKTADGKTNHTRIRVGYVSYDYYSHPVGLVINSVFKLHDRSKYEVFAYNANDNAKDSIYQKIKESAEHFIQIGKKDVQEVAKMIHRDEIDILIDLGLFTAGNRMDVFALRPAPIQVAYLGLAVTTGSDYYDYLLGDKYVIPPGSEKYYSEKIIYHPHSYHIMDHKQMYPEFIKTTKPRAEFNLPEKSFLFCNHANNYRTDPHIFTVWTNIVKKVENSTLVMKNFNQWSAENLKKEAKLRGLDPEKQLILSPGVGGGGHIWQKNLCDLYLDVHKYNGHTTSGDMLWSGVPMITYPGESMASRAAGSFALSCNVGEGIVHSWQEYEDRAVELAKDPAQLLAIRSKLSVEGRMNSPLFDTERWVRNLEQGFDAIMDRYRRGLPPAHIELKDYLSMK